MPVSTLAIIIIGLAGALLGGLALFLLMKRPAPKDGSNDSLLLIQRQIESFGTQIENRLNQVTGRVDERLRENWEAIQHANRSVGDRLDNAAKVVKQLDNRLVELQESQKRIYEVGKDVASLQDILRAPKPRGLLGELLLGELLKQILPLEHFTLQYGFKDGTIVDAVVRLRDDKLVPIDSKFPLENFRKIMAETDETQRVRFEKQFIDDVKKHIIKIGDTYIRPDEGTFDFALMYIPAENVYYEIVKGREEHTLIDLAFSRRVIPVSPNTFYIYLQAILLGLRGLQVEKHTQEIINRLARIRGEFQKFSEDFRVLGSHLSQARNKYEESTKRLERLDDKLAITSKEKAEDEPLTLPPA